MPPKIGGLLLNIFPDSFFFVLLSGRDGCLIILGFFFSFPRMTWHHEHELESIWRQYSQVSKAYRSYERV